MKIPFRPLNKVHELMNQIGYEPGYAYDDLVFSNDAVFIVQCGEADTAQLKLIINCDCEPAERNRILTNIIPLAKKMDLSITDAGKFSLREKKETGEIEIHFNKLEKEAGQ